MVRRAFCASRRQALTREIRSTRKAISILGKPLSTTVLPVGWGEHTARLNRFADRVLLRLPHLSIFKIFGRPPSVEPLRVLREELDRQSADLASSSDPHPES